LMTRPVACGTRRSSLATRQFVRPVASFYVQSRTARRPRGSLQARWGG
jgi:hypothetical protein